MKPNKILSWTGLAGLLLCGCTAEPDVMSVESDVRYPVELFNEISQMSTTRVNDEGFCNGDAVGIYVVNNENGAPGTLRLEGNQADNVRYVYDEPNNKWTPDETVYFRDKRTHVDIIGYYPYSTPTSVDAYPFEVAKDQSADAANGQLGGYEASDFLYAKSADIEPTSSRIALTFRHRMASVQVELSEGTGFADGEWSGLEKQVLVTNTVRKAAIDLATGAITPVGDVPSTGIVPYKNGEQFRAVVVPQTVAASAALFNITVDGTSYIFRKSEPFEYVDGKLHKFTVEVSRKGASGLVFELIGESITAWETDNVSHDATAREYVVIDVPAADAEGSALKAAVIAAGKDYTKIKHLKVTGEINQLDFNFMRDEMQVLQSINLKEVEIAAYNEYYPANEIPNYAFNDKSTLVRFVFPENITEIGYQAFCKTNLTGSLIIPNHVTKIDERAFCYCPLGGTLTLPKSLITINPYAFAQTNLTGTLNIPESVRSIKQGAFSSANFTGQLNLPAGLEYLGEWAFANCSGFTGSLTIPAKIKKIEDNCFFCCSGLNGQLTLPKNLMNIGKEAFYNCNFRGILNLPDGLISIGADAFRNCEFGGRLILPKSLAVLGGGAFYGNSRLTGIVEIPEDIIMIPVNVFTGCSQLEGVVLSKNTETIQAEAFNNCYQLNSITSHAQTPPTVDASAFNGVAKDNFTVEVPETSVADYSLAPVWKEFKRFAAHRDFSISRNLFRTLNAELSKTFVLRALSGEAWSVESKPDWVTVTPSSGTGKTEVTITVDALAKGGGNREGEVVFLLDGKDYRSRTRVEQYDYEYGDGDVVTVQRASKGAGVDLVFMGDCFDAKDIAEGKYLDGVNEAIGYFFAVEPYKSYRDYFNVYTVFGLSPDSGVGDVNTIREAKFGSQYGLQGSGKIVPDETVCFEYACKAPTVTAETVGRTLITLIENTEIYDGITYMWGDGSAIALCPMSRDEYPYDFRGIVQHEAGGHGFAKLGDEYIYHNAFIQTCGCICCPHVDEFNANKLRGWFENLSLTGNMYDVPWSHLIFDPQFSNLVDIYEGGYMHARGVFRSEPNSCMNNNIPYFSAISRETIVKYIKRYAGETFSFEEWKANDKALATDDEASLATRAKSRYTEYLTFGKQQQGPVYMGEKPVFKSNK